MMSPEPKTSRTPAAEESREAVSKEICVPIRSDLDIMQARQKGRELAAHLGFSPIDQTLIATAISELARNIVLYAKEGEVRFRTTNNGDRAGIIVTAADHGPGIRDVARVLQGGYSTSRSLGLGLAGARRLMDEFEIRSEPGRGTEVTVKKWKSAAVPGSNHR